MEASLYWHYFPTELIDKGRNFLIIVIGVTCRACCSALSSADLSGILLHGELVIEERHYLVKRSDAVPVDVLSGQNDTMTQKDLPSGKYAVCKSGSYPKKRRGKIMIFQIAAKKLALCTVGCIVAVVMATVVMVPDLSFAEGMIDKKLKEMNITLPAAAKPIASYVTSVKVGNLLYTSGHIPYNDGTTKITGKVGRDLNTEEGSKVARNVMLNCLATIKASIGDLDRVKRVVKVLGMVNATEDYKEQPKVLNGASDLLVQIFGEKGKHTRSAFGVASLPNGVPVEIEMILEVE